jgi:hypothetical protein
MKIIINNIIPEQLQVEEGMHYDTFLTNKFLIDFKKKKHFRAIAYLIV